jgi:hypothetical protein
VSSVELTDGRGMQGMGEEPNKTYDGEKAWPAMNYSILSAMNIMANLYLEKMGACSEL